MRRRTLIGSLVLPYMARLRAVAARLGRQPRAAAKFLEKYRQRVMFGTDMERDPAMYRGWWRLLETADEFIAGRLWWRYYGLELPAPVLQSLYRANARRVLSWEKW